MVSIDDRWPLSPRPTAMSGIGSVPQRVDNTATSTSRGRPMFLLNFTKSGSRRLMSDCLANPVSIFASPQAQNLPQPHGCDCLTLSHLLSQ